MAYKKDQGRIARMATFWLLALLIFYGCTALHTELATRFTSLGTALGGVRVPIIGLDLSPALLIVVLVLATSLWLLHRWLDKPKYAEGLIETEQELRKVTWPSLDDAINSSFVVVFCVLFLMAFLAGADWALGRMAKVVLLGQS